ncbi:hypothetical protein TrVE_jg1817 [Triparma verrucosa]|uniref:EF-hand domain-containing protein n=1 Tax=Triparma verrucosa TaxID=1606542 RepID=A0A9W7BZW4_9STRA|nr:hypothetical protein TrVE_jg1817 [Triparma verrucosa]
MAFKMLLIKGAKPVGAAVLGFAAYKGYEEWQRAGELLKVSKNKDQMKKLFDKIDTDKSGSINSTELQKALNEAGMDVNVLTVQAMMYSADKDSDGTISKEEWHALIEKILDDRTPNTMDKAAEKYAEAHQKPKGDGIVHFKVIKK